MDLTSKPEDGAQRWGSTLARLWRAIRNRDAQFGAWFIRTGCPKWGVALVRWGLRIALIAAAVYSFATLVLVMAAALLIARLGGKAIPLPEPSPEEEWRGGWAGFGLYDSSDRPIDPHDPNDIFRQP